MEESSRSCWSRSCCCCCGQEEEEEEEERKRRDEEEEPAEDRSPRSCRSWTSVSATMVDQDPSNPSGRQPDWFHTSQARRVRVPRGRSNSDPSRAATSQQIFTWNAGSEFGAAQSYSSSEKSGEGAFASVYKGISRINGQSVASKVIRMKTEEGIPFTAIREASLLKHSKHANIVSSHDIIHTRDTLTFVFEFVQTDSAQYMTQHPGGLHSHNVRIFMFQSLRALGYIHSRRISHRDSKPHNSLISYSGELKSADFGSARSKSIPAQNFSSDVVTSWYRPPDVLSGSIDYSTASDMWGAGCIFIEMSQGSPAFAGGSDESEQSQNIWTVSGFPLEDRWPGVSSSPNYRPERFIYCRPKPFRDVWKRLEQLPYKTEDSVQKISKSVPTERISAQEALQHPYFSMLPAPIMHLRDTVSIFKVPGVRSETEFRDIFNPGRRSKSSSLPSAGCW